MIFCDGCKKGGGQWRRRKIYGVLSAKIPNLKAESSTLNTGALISRTLCSCTSIRTVRADQLLPDVFLSSVYFATDRIKVRAFDITRTSIQIWNVSVGIGSRTDGSWKLRGRAGFKELDTYLGGLADRWA